MGVKRMGPPPDLVLAIKEHGRIEHFVETGTYRGDTAAWAAGHFARVTTIELSPQFHAAAAGRFAGQPQVEVLVGNSAAVLRGMVATLAGPALFWLDAHWMGGDSASAGEQECPILDEIAAIDAATSAHVILVDDAQLFCAPPARPHRADVWPDLVAVTAALGANGTRYVAILDDVFVAVPVAQRAFVSGWLQDLATKRRADGSRRSWWRRLSHAD